MAGRPKRSTTASTVLLDAKSGRVDARRVARFFGLSLSALAKGLGTTPLALRKAPASPRFQRGLLSLLRIASSLLTLFDSPEQSRAWLNTPHPELDHVAPLDLVKEQKAGVVADLLDDALLGHPG